MKKRILISLLVFTVFASLLSMSLFTSANIGNNDKIVIHHTASFGGELALLKGLMTETYGDPEVYTGELGREYYIWETGPRTRLVGSITQTHMQNATLSPALTIYNLPDRLKPDLATHGGICGAVFSNSRIMDVYAPDYVAFSAEGLYAADGFHPFGRSTWNPNTGKFLDERPIWIATDHALTDLLAAGFNKAVADPGFQSVWLKSGLPYQPTLWEETVQVASNYFVANDELNASWAEMFRMDPKTIDTDLIWGSYDNRVYEVGGLDMETSAVVWVYKQANIPTAVLRYPSDLARAEAKVQIKNFGSTASAVGGYAFYYGLQGIIQSIESGELTIHNGKVLVSK